MTKGKWLKVDCDGVIGDFVPLVSKFSKEKYNVDFSHKDITEWNPNISEDLTFDEIAEELDKNHKERYIDMPVIPGAKKSLYELKDRGYNIQITTSRPDHLKEVTRKWLDKNRIPYDALITGAKEGKPEGKGEILIDDKIDHIVRFSEIGKPIMFVSHYNHDADIDNSVLTAGRYNGKNNKYYIDNRKEQWDEILKIIGDHDDD